MTDFTNVTDTEHTQEGLGERDGGEMVTASPSPGRHAQLCSHSLQKHVSRAGRGPDTAMGFGARVPALMQLPF